ncbi:MAG: NRDE family protein [Alphaproteobacteria bacterium]
MCSVVILARPGHRWPLLVAANRDEMADRPWRPPGRHWLDRPNVVAGLDELGGGSWLGVNDDGVVAAILNRAGTLGPADGKRSRGELVLEALDHSDAADAVEALCDIDPAAYRPFNLLIADNHDVYWLANLGEGEPDPVRAAAVPEGVSMLTAFDLNDQRDRRVRDYLPRFRAAPPPDPETGTWTAWQTLLASRLHDAAAGPAAAMCFITPTGFGTTSSSLIALPAASIVGGRPLWQFAAGPPDSTGYVQTPM